VGALRVGRLTVGPSVLGYGSCGTVVFEGDLAGRRVAVKRLLSHFHELARKELAALVRSDGHPAVLRCYAMEQDEHFVYVALERCACTLAAAVEAAGGADAGRPLPPLRLYERDGAPAPQLWALMRDVAGGLAALHAEGVIHRDVKPHNVLLTPAGRAKLSDLGLSRSLRPDEPSSHAGESGGGAGAGTAGWRAPERLAPGARQGRAVDTWALGCLLFYCLSGGGHPWGDAPLHRDAAVAGGAAPQLGRLAAMPEAVDLLVRPRVARARARG